MEKVIKIQLEDKVVILKVDDGGNSFDTEDILRIDYSNIVGELLTFPVLFNRVGILKAQAESAVRQKKFEVDVYKAGLAETTRKDMQTVTIGTGGIKKYKDPVKDAVDNSVTSDEGYKLKYSEYLKAQKNADYIDSLYWSAKSKDDKLKALSHYIPKEFENELIEGVVNGIKIKGINNQFNSKRK